MLHDNPVILKDCGVFYSPGKCVAALDAFAIKENKICVVMPIFLRFLLKKQNRKNLPIHTGAFACELGAPGKLTISERAVSWKQ